MELKKLFRLLVVTGALVGAAESCGPMDTGDGSGGGAHGAGSGLGSNGGGDGNSDGGDNGGIDHGSGGGVSFW